MAVDMPRKKNAPQGYLPRRPMEIMQVLRPYQAVADWCDGRVVNQGVKFWHIEFEFEGETYWAHEGTVIARHFRADGTVTGHYVISRSIEEFEENYRKATPDDYRSN